MAHEKTSAQYPKELARAKKHMTKKYDSAFAAAKKKGLRWYPWVGKNYDKTRILVLGKSTYYKEGEDWSDKWQKYCESNSVNPNRVLVGECLGDDQHKPFGCTSATFIEGIDKKTKEIFWKSVAFSNHCQEVVLGVSGGCRNKNQKEQDDSAFCEILDILKPNLCLVWSVGLTDDLSQKLRSKSVMCRERKLGVAFPRVIKADHDRPPIIGLGHPSRGYSPPDWRKFLLSHSASKALTKEFIQYLKCQSTK